MVVVLDAHVSLVEIMKSVQTASVVDIPEKMYDC